MYSLLALGFTLVYGILELINFSHFNVFMVGSFIALLRAAGVRAVRSGGDPDRPAAGRRPAGGVRGHHAVLRACSAFDRAAYLRPLRNVKGPAAMITTIGVSYILFNIILLTSAPIRRTSPTRCRRSAGRSAAPCCDFRVVLIWVDRAAADAGLYMFVQRAGSARRCAPPRRTPRPPA